MSIVSPFHDACIAGCLANAALSASVKAETPAPRETANLAASEVRAEALASQAPPCRAGWRRLLDALFGLVSGPTMPHGANRA